MLEFRFHQESPDALEYHMNHAQLSSKTEGTYLETGYHHAARRCNFRYSRSDARKQRRYTFRRQHLPYQVYRPRPDLPAACAVHQEGLPPRFQHVEGLRDYCCCHSAYCTRDERNPRIRPLPPFNPRTPVDYPIQCLFPRLIARPVYPAKGYVSP